MTLNTYELTNIYKNADNRFQNNLYSQVSDRQVHPRSFWRSQPSTELQLY